MPWATAPWICPSTISGLMTGPQSSTSAYARTVTRPVSGSTSTRRHVDRARERGPGRIEELGRLERRRIGAARPAPAECASRASSATDRPRPGTPRTLTRPSVELEVGRARLERRGRDREELRPHASAPPPSTAPPCAMAPRLANVPVPGGAVSVSGGAHARPTRAARRADPPQSGRPWWHAPGPATGTTRGSATLPSAAIATVAASGPGTSTMPRRAIGLAAHSRVLRVAGDAHAEEPAVPARRVALPDEPLVAGQVERQRERLRIVAAVVDEARRGGEGIGVARDQVPPSDLGGIEAEPIREEIERALHHEDAHGHARRRDRRRAAACSWPRPATSYA